QCADAVSPCVDRRRERTFARQGAGPAAGGDGFRIRRGGDGRGSRAPQTRSPAGQLARVVPCLHDGHPNRRARNGTLGPEAQSAEQGVVPSLILAASQEKIAMKKGLIVLVILVLLLLWVGSTFVGHRNEMVRKREAVNAAWSQVDVVLQRRADLIPNLVQTVKGFAAHEEKVFGDIAAARAAMIGAKTPQEKIAANGALD